MRRAEMCWGPECSTVIEQVGRGRTQRYCSTACRQRSVRRHGGKAPTEPYPPYERLTSPEPAPTVVSSPEISAPPVSRPVPATASGPTAGGAEVEAAGSAEIPAASHSTQLHVTVTEDSTVPVAIKVHPLVARYKHDLEQIGQAETRQGLQVIQLAERLVSSATSPAASASISKELDRLLSELEQSTPAKLAERDPSLIIRQRTLEKLTAVGAA